MTQLLAMSVDCPISPSIRLKAIDGEGHRDQPLGWGFGWYPAEGRAAMVIKDPTSVGTNALTNVLSDWERFSSTLFVAHLRGAAKRTKHQDTHPFSRTWAGRDWLLAHNGDLRHGFREALPIDANRESFEPIGRTDSEHLFCWILNRMQEQGARTIAAVAPEQWMTWFEHINSLGTLNVVFTDGMDLIAWSDTFGYRPLHWTRHVPPSPLIQFEGPEVDLALGSELDLNRTSVVLSTTPWSDTGWQKVGPGRMLIARRGEVIWQAPVRSLADQPTGDKGHLDLAAVQTPGPAATAREQREFLPNAVLPMPSQPMPELILFDRNHGQTGTSQAAQRAPDFDETSRSLQRAARRLHAPEVFTAGLTREHGDDFGEHNARTRVLETIHDTIYTYEKPVLHSTHVLRLQPVTDDMQELLEWDVQITPVTRSSHFDDVFGNHAIDVAIREPYESLRIRSRSLVRLYTGKSPRLRAPNARHRLRLVWMPWQRQMMQPYLLPPELPETQLRELSDYAMSFAERQDFDLVETLKDMNRTIYRDYRYTPNATNFGTTPFDVYVAREGVCQDFSNLFIALCRLLDVPARYRVGYIFTGGKYENERQGDASHAWVEVYIPLVGWRGFDPTNGCVVADDHVRVACGRNFRDATPTSGTLWEGGSGEKLSVKVTMMER
jgi:transglutaminase-like putative cysteine protease/predicted glutamine amidotransferase